MTYPTSPRPLRIAVVAGARPNFPKVAPLLRELGQRPGVDAFLVHTGQHYDPELSDAFISDLGLPAPRWSLGAGSGSHAEQTARILVEFERRCLAERPDCVVAVGDVNSTLACTLVAAKLGIRSVHVEAGLRSRDREMPEEVNRLVTDTLADRLYTYCDEADRNLRTEGHPDAQIVQAGNVMIDSLLRLRPLATEPALAAELGLKPRGFAVVTLHRPALVDVAERLVPMVRALSEASNDLPLIWPVHPRSLERMRSFGLLPRDGSMGQVHRLTGSSFFLVPALRYVEFLWLLDRARLVITDSGGVQEESTVLGIPCVTLRANTEREVTLRCGTNRLAGLDPERAREEVTRSLAAPMPATWPVPPGWDGRAAGRVVDDLLRWLKVHDSTVSR
jgi:UDP-N-acetylglucosamine 2-epimerase (non-hydrolysing)